MNSRARLIATLAISILLPAKLLAGGSGLNIIVVVNTNSANSLQLGNYYCEKRQVPPQNVLRIGWTGPATNWIRSDFEARLRTPLNALLSSRQLTNQIEFVLLSMDIPYRVYDTGTVLTLGTNSTTSALFYGFKPDGCVVFCPGGYSSCTLPDSSTSAYAASEGIFRQTPPISASSNSWLTMMLTSSNLSEAKALVDRGAASDYSFPTQSVYLVHFDFDPVRGLRYLNYDDSIFDNRVLGAENVVRTNAYAPSVPGYQLGSQFGLSIFNLPANLFAPGAMADVLTSYSGYLFETFGQIHALYYLGAGATASYGTVAEPCLYLEKFPSPRNYFYQARGFSIAECYYMSVTNPYQGVLVGEPLAAPFAMPCVGAWSNLPSGAPLSGNTNLTVEFSAADPSRAVQQVDLFLDGTFLQTLTNLAPRQSNTLYVTINGHPTNYTIPASATLKSVASNLTARLNTTSYSNATKVAAFAHGDRIKLRSLDLATLGSQVPIATSNFIGNATALTTFLASNRTNFLDSPALGRRNFLVTNTPTVDLPPVGAWLQLAITNTNNTSLTTISVTNVAAGTPVAQLISQLVDSVNTNGLLAGSDGCFAEDFIDYAYKFYYPANTNDHRAEFNLLARSSGAPAAQLQVELRGSSAFVITPAGIQTLDENLDDLWPRSHLYVTAGATNLAVTFPFNTTNQPDGFHELTAVAYEGSHVRTQKRVAQNVRIQNTPLAATFTCLLCDTNTAMEATLQFLVAANTNTISRIELFSTGGSWGVVSNQQNASFSLAATNLGAGLHPFCSLVTRNDGKQYRTETKWIRLRNDEPPFALGVTGSAPTVSWPATAGRRYEILSTTDVTNAFSLRDTVTPTNSPGRWSETNNSSDLRLYRVRSAP